jgi:hypothetical protein
VALGEAAAGHQPHPGIALLQPAQLEQGVDRLLGGGLDEAAGVHDDRVGLLGRPDGHVAATLHQALEVAAVHLVLGAAEHPEVVGRRRRSHP